jgi:lipopolysaccharide biosynthesis regulator YciM
MEWPYSFFLYVVLLVAVALGYFLGRRERRKRRPQTAVIRDYYQGLNILLGDRPELGVDRFIQAMEVSDESIDVHLALAGVVRRRGEVEKAIRIHQNLLANPSLSTANKQLIEFELARDYHAAGLLDRSESLLTEIVDRNAGQRKQAAGLLLDIYELEKDWDSAIDIGRRFASSDGRLKTRLLHFHCELGKSCLDRGELKRAVEHSRKAISLDGSNPRGHWLAAEIDFAQKRFKHVLRHLRRVVELAPGLAVEVLDIYAIAAQNLGQESAFLEFLDQNVRQTASAPMLEAFVRYRRKHSLPIDYEEILRLIAQHPRFEHVAILLELLNRKEDEQQAEVRNLLAQIVVSTEGYQCGNCGFPAQSHMWHCPTCKNWGSFVRQDSQALKS